MKNYRIGWIDATLQDNYKNEKELKKAYLEDGLKLTEIIPSDDGWYDLSVEFNFKAKNNKEAVDYIKKFFDNYGRNVDVFTLKGMNNKFYFTEENL